MQQSRATAARSDYSIGRHQSLRYFSFYGSDTAVLRASTATTVLEGDTAAASCTLVEMTFGSQQQTIGKFLLSLGYDGDRAFCV